MKKRLLALLLAILTLTLPLSACGEPPTPGESTSSEEATATPTLPTVQTPSAEETEKSEPPTEDDPQSALKRSLAGDWSMLLARRERMYGDMLWALELAEAFYASPDWNTLEQARIALTAARLRIDAIDTPDYTVLPAKHAELIASGCDVSGFWQEMSSVERTKAELLAYCTNLAYDLYQNAFFLPQAECAEEYAAYVRHSLEIDLKLTACFTDHLLCVLGGEKLRTDFAAYLEENNPLLTEHLPSLTEDLSVIEQRTADVLDEMEESINALNLCNGRRQLAADRFWDLYEAGGLAEHLLPLPKSSSVFPIPDTVNYLTATVYQYYEDEGGKAHHAATGAPVTLVPNRYLIRDEGMSDAEYMTYVLLLNGLGYSPDRVADTDTEKRAFYTVGDASVMISLSGGEFTLFISGAGVSPIPLYYHP